MLFVTILLAIFVVPSPWDAAVLAAGVTWEVAETSLLLYWWRRRR